MDRSYRLKMEEKLNNNTVTKEYVLNCIAKYESKINQLAYKERQYRNAYGNNYKLDMDKLIAYRKPFVDFLVKEFQMSLAEIKNAVAEVKEKNIPTKNVCDQIREIICSNAYWVE